MAQIPKYADEAVFPQPHLMMLRESEDADVLLPAQWGLTKREYFAAVAMQGMLSNAQFVHFVCKKADEQDIPNSRVLSDLAVAQADTLLAELAKASQS